MKESEVWEYLEMYCEDSDYNIEMVERKRKAKLWKRGGEGVDERARVPFVHGDLYEQEGIDR